MFSFFAEIFSKPGVVQTVLILSMISVVGLALGRIRIKSFSFGGAFVFFVAILAGHLASKAGITVNAPMMELAKSFGIMIFVYTLGLQAGPGFIASLRKGGIGLTVSAVIGIALETVLAIAVMHLFKLSPEETVGIYSGSVTNTPMLIAAQESASDAVGANLIGSAYAAVYPVSVILVMMSIALLCKMFPSSFQLSVNDTGKTAEVETECRMSDKKMAYRKIRVTKGEVAGYTFGELKLGDKYGVNITHLDRSGVTIVPSASTVLQFGDNLTVTGDETKIEVLSQALGNELKRLDEPRLIPLLSGIFLGVLLGCIPFSIPGLDTTVKLGIAGGSIIMGIVAGAGNLFLRMHAYTTRSANLMLRQLGITFFFAAVGFNVGGTFVENVFCIRGLTWIGISVVIIVLPVIVMGIINDRIFKYDFGYNLGALCGMCTNPNALSFAGNLLGNDKASEAYASVYPVVTFLRIFLAQVLMLTL